MKYAAFVFIYYGHSSSVPTVDKNHADTKWKVEDLFGRVRQITKNEGLSDVKTRTFVMLNPVS
jgi:hypothetical protein